MIRIFGISIALALAGSGIAMAQRLETQSKMPKKVATRLERSRVAAELGQAIVPANTVLDVEGRIVPMRAVTIGDDTKAEPCSETQKRRPADIRAIAKREAKAIELPLETLDAVLRAESQLASEIMKNDGSASLPRITPAAGSTNSSCAEVAASIQRGVGQLNALRKRYPNPLHHFAAYRDGDEAFIASGGVPKSVETMRFIITAMNELSGATSTPLVITQPKSPSDEQIVARVPSPQRLREHPIALPDPRWASGFVFNIE